MHLPFSPRQNKRVVAISPRVGQSTANMLMAASMFVFLNMVVAAKVVALVVQGSEFSGEYSHM